MKLNYWLQLCWALLSAVSAHAEIWQCGGRLTNRPTASAAIPCSKFEIRDNRVTMLTGDAFSGFKQIPATTPTSTPAETRGPSGVEPFLSWTSTTLAPKKIAGRQSLLDYRCRVRIQLSSPERTNARLHIERGGAGKYSFDIQFQGRHKKQTLEKTIPGQCRSINVRITQIER